MCAGMLKSVPVNFVLAFELPFAVAGDDVAHSLPHLTET